MRLVEIKKQDCIFEVGVVVEDNNSSFGHKMYKALYTMEKSYKNEDLINGNRFDNKMKSKIEKRFRKAGYKVIEIELLGIYFSNTMPYDRMTERCKATYNHYTANR